MKNEVFIQNQENLREKLYIIRGESVMLDRDLAEIYGYETKDFNRQVKNNIDKFDEDFRFQLTDDEIDSINLRCKNSTSSWGGTRYKPYAFTEQGIYMLMTVLRGELAVKQSKALIRLFKQMKDYIVESQNLIPNKDILRLSMQITQNTKDIAEIKSEMATKAELAKVIHDFTDPKTRKEYLILNGESVEAAIAYSTIYGSAKKTVFVVDNYIDLKTLLLLKNIPNGVVCKIFSDNINRGLTKADLADFNKEYPNIPLSFQKTNKIYHDRYIVLDYNTSDEKIYHCGASSKDSGKKINSIIEIEDIRAYHKIVDNLLCNPHLTF